MSRHVETGAKLLADAQVGAVVFHCTAVSTFSAQMGQEIQQRIEQASGLPAFSTSEAIVAALKGLRAKKIILLTPYIEEVNVRECAFLAHHGFEVIAQMGLGIDTNAEMGKLPEQVWVDQALKLQDPQADAYFISCTAVRSAEAIERIEALLDRPVITSNQAMVWFGLRKYGINDHAPGYGRLFDLQNV
jgi:maleate isomerase